MGGFLSARIQNSISNVYYAKLSSSGIGSWQQTTGYPVDAEGGSCQISGGYIYCVDGAVPTGTLTSTHGVIIPGVTISTTSPGWSPAVFYAQVSSGGVGPWREATPYPYETNYEEFYMVCVVN